MQVYRNYQRNGVEYFYRKSAPPPFCSPSTMPREAKRRTFYEKKTEIINPRVKQNCISKNIEIHKKHTPVNNYKC